MPEVRSNDSFASDASCESAGKQVLGIDEPSTGLPEALRSFPLSEPENIDTLTRIRGAVEPPLGRPGGAAVVLVTEANLRFCGNHHVHQFIRN